MGVVSVSLPGELLEQIDEIADEHGYSGRSEVVREAGRKLVAEFENRQLADRPLVATITVLYPYGSTEIETELTEFRHDHADLIASNSHSCIEGDEGCVETFVVESDLSAVERVVRTIEAIDERVQVDHSAYPVAAIGEERLLFDQ